MAAVNIVQILGSDSNVVGKIAHGLMTFTFTPHPVPNEQAFEVIKAGIDSLPPGVKMFLNAGEFYDNDNTGANLTLVSDFFERYPHYADRAFLSVKGGMEGNEKRISCSPENLRRSVDRIIGLLRGFKKLDLFEPARVDPRVSIEDTMTTLAGLVQEGKFDYIGLSEVRAATVRRANAIHRVAAVEVEVSPWLYEKEGKEVIATTKELGIALLAYSPLGQGFLTGQIKSRADLPSGDMRLMYERFFEKNFEHNLKIVEQMKVIASKKGITPAQLCLAWVGSLGSHVIPLPGSTKVARVLENQAAASITLTSEECESINRLITEIGVKGDRYFGKEIDVFLWG